MKKKLRNILSLLIVSFIMTGCVKFNANMEIKKDKSMDFEIIYAIDTTYFGDEEINSNDEDFNDLKNSGFVVSDYVDGVMKGVRLSRSIVNIDLVSSNEDTIFSLSNLMNSDENTDSVNKSLFKVKKGLLKNKYTAKFEFNSSDSSLGDSIDDSFGSTEDILDEDLIIDDENLDDTDVNDDLIVDDGISGDLENDIDMDFDPSLMMETMDLSFNVNLPYEVISNNASDVSNEGKTLKWNLMASGDAEYIEFEFELYNMMTIYIAIGVIVVLIVLMLSLIIRKFGKKKNNQVNNNGQQLNSQSIDNNIVSQGNNINNVSNDMLVNNNMMNQGMMNNQVNNIPLNNSYMSQNIVGDQMNSLVDNNLQNINAPQQINVEHISVPDMMEMNVQSNMEQSNVQTSQFDGNRINEMGQSSMGMMQNNNRMFNSNNIVSNNNGMNGNNMQMFQQNIPNVMDMKPNMSFMTGQDNNMGQSNVSQENNNIQNTVGMIQNNNQMTNMNNVMSDNNGIQNGNSNISSMNFVSDQNNQSNGQ